MYETVYTYEPSACMNSIHVWYYIHMYELYISMNYIHNNTYETIYMNELHTCMNCM